VVLEKWVTYLMQESVNFEGFVCVNFLYFHFFNNGLTFWVGCLRVVFIFDVLKMFPLRNQITCVDCLIAFVILNECWYDCLILNSALL